MIFFYCCCNNLFILQFLLLFSLKSVLRSDGIIPTHEVPKEVASN